VESRRIGKDKRERKQELKRKNRQELQNKRLKEEMQASGVERERLN